jgi:phosphatidylglycerol:prolipoprotein diacylglycerol transferase
MIGVKVIPTQLIMSVANFAHFFLLIFIANKVYKAGKDGVVAGCYLLFYSIGRFLIEFLRDDPRGGVGGLSTSQFISLFIFAAGVLTILVCGVLKKEKRN